MDKQGKHVPRDFFDLNDSIVLLKEDVETSAWLDARIFCVCDDHDSVRFRVGPDDKVVSAVRSLAIFGLHIQTKHSQHLLDVHVDPLDLHVFLLPSELHLLNQAFPIGFEVYCLTAWHNQKRFTHVIFIQVLVVV